LLLILRSFFSIMLTSSISYSPPASISSPEGTQYIALFSFVYVTSIPYLHMSGDNTLNVRAPTKHVQAKRF